MTPNDKPLAAMTDQEVDEAAAKSLHEWDELGPDKPRGCYYVLESWEGADGFIPSWVVEGEAGHRPLIGNGPFARPWFWGPDFETARRICATANAELGLNEDDVEAIVGSSIAASIRQDAAQDAARVRYDREVGR